MATPSLLLEIGNTYELLPEHEAVFSKSAPDVLKVHKFELFVRLVDNQSQSHNQSQSQGSHPTCQDSDVARVRSVEFHLHETFSPSVFVKERPPFKTVHTAYGWFQARIVINFFHAPPAVFSYELVFATGGSSFTFEVEAGHGSSVRKTNNHTKPFPHQMRNG